MSFTRALPLDLCDPYGDLQILNIPGGNYDQVRHGFTINEVPVCIYSKSHASEEGLKAWVKEVENLSRIQSMVQGAGARPNERTNLDFFDLSKPPAPSAPQTSSTAASIATSIGPGTTNVDFFEFRDPSDARTQNSSASGGLRSVKK